MGIIADKLREQLAMANAPDSWERIMEDVHDVFRFTTEASYGQRAHAYINAYHVQSVRTEDGTAVMSVVQDLCRRAYELGGGTAELDGAKEDVAALVGILRKLAECAETAADEFGESE